MQNFTFCTPTKVVFGRDIEQDIGAELKAQGATCVLLHYGSGSVKRSGLLDTVLESLQKSALRVVELGGVEANPKLSLVRQGTALCKAQGVDFLLAAGGGSVIDSTKAIGLSIASDCDFWEFVSAPQKATACMPLATVLTLSAAGSEMSNSVVITNDENQLKRGVTTELVRPVVSFLNPANTCSVSPYQTACGIVDIMMHTLERYLTAETDNELVDRMSEGLLLAVKDAGLRALADPNDYEARATLMWASSLSHNDLTGCGKKRLFPVHKLEHDISGVCDHVAHGAGLAVLFPAWAQFICKYDVRKFAQLATRVFGVSMDFEHPETTALRGIAVIKQYFAEIGMPVTWAQLGVSDADLEQSIAKTMALTPSGQLASYVPLGETEIRAIYALAHA